METIHTTQRFSADWKSLDSRRMPLWFPEAKFGIFIHWGVYSVPAWKGIERERYASYAEWYYSSVMNDDGPGRAFHNQNYGSDVSYRDFAQQFRGELWNPQEWANLFCEAGARYVILTSKHHDGFCLWPTENPHKKGWNAGEVGPCRDLVGELTQAVRKAGLRMGLYYSIPEWETHSTSRREKGCFISKLEMKKHGVEKNRYVREILTPQLKELVQKYAPSVIFSDGGEWDFDEEYFATKEFLAWLYNEAPNRDEVVVNDRWAKGIPGVHGDYFSSEYQDTDVVGETYPWEESRGIGKSYGWNRAERLEDYSKPEELAWEMLRVVSRGGNFLLNVGPRADGGIPVYQEYVLRKLGEWLAVVGEGVYGTEAYTGKGCEGLEESCFTKKGEALYVHFQQWPQEGLRFPHFHGIRRARLLNTGMVVPVTHEDQGFSMVLPQPLPGKTANPLAWCLCLEGVE